MTRSEHRLTPDAADRSSSPARSGGMFDRIAGVYDLMNTAMTAGLHHALARARRRPRRARAR